jgi:hypothetical protein
VKFIFSRSLFVLKFRSFETVGNCEPLVFVVAVTLIKKGTDCDKGIWFFWKEKCKVSESDLKSGK